MAKELVWIANTYDPKNPYAEVYITRSFDQTQSEAVEAYRTWLADKVIGEPRSPQGTHTSAELREKGLVGVYVWKDVD